MKRGLARDEKQLAVLLLAIAALSVGFFAWRKVNRPPFLSTSLPVLRAKALDKNRMFVQMRELNRGAVEPLPIAAIYDVPTGQKVWTDATDVGQGITTLDVSSDGHWSLQTRRTPGVPGVVTLSDLTNHSRVQTFPAMQGNFTDATHFAVYDGPKWQFWVINNGRPVLQRSQVMWEGKKYIGELSQDWKLALEIETEQGFLLKHYTIIDFTNGRRLAKLPGDKWENLSWQKNNTQLWGVATIFTVPARADILRYDLPSGRTNATRLEVSKEVEPSIGGLIYRFSSDGRWLVGERMSTSVVVWDAATGRLLKQSGELTRTHEYLPEFSPAFSQDGKTLLRPTREGVEFYRLNDGSKP